MNIKSSICILWYPTYVYQFFNFPYNTKIECWPVFKQDPLSRIKSFSNKILSQYLTRHFLAK